MKPIFYAIADSKHFRVVTQSGIVVNSDSTRIIGFSCREAEQNCSKPCRAALEELHTSHTDEPVALSCGEPGKLYYVYHFVIEKTSLYAAISREASSRDLGSVMFFCRSFIQSNTVALARYLPVSGKVIFCNDKFASLTGQGKESIMYSSIFDYIPQEERFLVKESLSSLTKEIPSITMEHSLMQPDETEQTAVWQANALVDADSDEVTAIDVCCCDISDHFIPKRKITALFEESLSAQEFKALRYSVHLGSRKAAARVMKIDEKTYDTYLDRAKKKISENAPHYMTELIKLLSVPPQ